MIEIDGDMPIAVVDGTPFYASDPPRWVSIKGRKGDEYDDDPEDAL
jgi:hypothetical protein